jgi:uncharacterized protein YndB with AHSA1/START domain
MAGMAKGQMLDRISSDSVREATGRGWDEWLETLDAAGAAGWSHREIVAYLKREHGDETTGLWRQSLTVGYEQARGKRALGETADAGFEVGVRRTVDASPDAVWKALTSRPELWLGPDVTFRKGERYSVPGASGEIRVVKPDDRVRLTWQLEGWAAPATMQLALSRAPSGKTTVTAHLEKLPDADARDAVREHLREALDRLVAAAS